MSWPAALSGWGYCTPWPSPPRAGSWPGFTASKLLGRSHVPCIVLTDDALLGELVEIEENLVRHDLTVLERGEHHKRAKEIYEAAPFGPDGQRNNFVAQPYTAEMAGKAGVSRRTVEQEIQIASGLDQAVKDLIRGTPLDDRKADLLFLARLPAQAQKKVVAIVNKGQAKTVRQAHRVLQGKASFDKIDVRADGLYNLRRILELATAGPTWEGAAGGEAARLLARYEDVSDLICRALTSALTLLDHKGSAGKKARRGTKRPDGTQSPRRKEQLAAPPNLPLFEGAT